MTTWTEVTGQVNDFDLPADVPNDYVEIGYVVNGYIEGLPIWGEVDQASTDWA